MIWRSTTFRFAALVFGLQVVTTAVLIVGLGAILRQQSYRNAVATAETIRDDLVATRAEGGEAALAAAIGIRTARQWGDDAAILLTDSNGAKIAGNLTGWPAAMPLDGSYQRLDLQRPGTAEREAVLARATGLAGGRRLLTGVRVENQRQLLAMLERASLLAVALGILLAALAAWLAARLIVARLQTSIATLDAVQAGDLSRRVPDDRTGDAFARIGGDINRTLDRLAALIAEMRIATDSLAHDLKSPLTRLRVSLEQALAEVRDPAGQEAVERALAESERLMAIVHTALSITRAEAGIGRENFAPVDLGEMLETIAEIYAPLVEEHDRSLVVDAGSGLMNRVDRQLLGQAVGNLIDNALRYGEGTVRLTAARRASGVALSVSDEGRGIPPDLRAEALKRFARLDTARSGSGAGLGLSLAQAVAHLHGGILELGDARPGLIVTLLLPNEPGGPS